MVKFTHIPYPPTCHVTAFLTRAVASAKEVAKTEAARRARRQDRIVYTGLPAAAITLIVTLSILLFRDLATR
jgi:hypothetical protein